MLARGAPSRAVPGRPRARPLFRVAGRAPAVRRYAQAPGLVLHGVLQGSRSSFANVSGHELPGRRAYSVRHRVTPRLDAGSGLDFTAPLSDPRASRAAVPHGSSRVPPSSLRGSFARAGSPPPGAPEGGLLGLPVSRRGDTRH